MYWSVPKLESGINSRVDPVDWIILPLPKLIDPEMVWFPTNTFEPVVANEPVFIEVPPLPNPEAAAEADINVGLM